jgi:hypothetical protein
MDHALDGIYSASYVTLGHTSQEKNPPGPTLDTDQYPSEENCGWSACQRFRACPQSKGRPAMITQRRLKGIRDCCLCSQPGVRRALEETGRSAPSSLLWSKRTVSAADPAQTEKLTQETGRSMFVHAPSTTRLPSLIVSARDSPKTALQWAPQMGGYNLRHSGRPSRRRQRRPETRWRRQVESERSLA